MISIIIPTIRGRERWLRRCLASYRATTPEPHEFVIERDHPACGLAWAAGGARARGDYLHFTADDVSALPGWAEAAASFADDGCLPCPRVLNPDLTLQSCGTWGAEMPDGAPTDIARIPFLSREMWEHGGWCLPTHYYTDNWIAWRGIELGYPTLICREYELVHHFASEGRIDEQMPADHEVYLRWVAGDRR